MHLLLLVLLILGFACAPGHDSGQRSAALVETATIEVDHAGVAALDQGDVADRIATIGKHDSRVMEHLDYLTGRIGPRLAGSENHRTACEWARDQFAEFGLTNAHLEKSADVAVGFDRGRSTGLIRSPIKKALHFSTPAWTAGTKGKVRARAVMLPDTPGELVKVSNDIEGKWVLWRPTGDFKRDGAYIKTWDDLALDVAGVITPSSGEFIYTMGRPLADWGDLPTTPAISLLSSEWDEIANLLSQGKRVSLEFNIRNHFKKGPVPVHNVVADIPGAEMPDEYVIVGAHIDSHDGGTGATDNGTGVAAVLEAARILMASGAKPKRTIRFVLFGGEEIGLVGSGGYVRDHPDLLPNISAVYNMDMGADYVSGITATETMLDDFEQVFARVKALDEGMAFTIDHAEFLPLALDCSSASSAWGAGGCGSAPGPTSPLNVSGCGAGVLTLDDGVKETVMGDSLLFRRVLKASECGGATAKFDGPVEGGLKMSAGCGSNVAGDASTGKDSTVVVRRMAVGSSDHAPFLAAGVPAFSWTQRGENPHPYYPHTQKDTFDQAVPRYQKHSATVIALAALGTANLDQLLSRENLQEE
jgi:hypothetical protein